jgi:hypothetical protein
MGRACVNRLNERAETEVTWNLFEEVLEDIRSGNALPTLESA